MKNKNTSKFFLKSGIAVVICIFLIATSFSSATMLYSASQTRSITSENQSIDGDSSEMLGYKFDFTEPELQQTTLQGTRYTRAVVRGCLNIGAIGAPSLPVKPVRLAVPMGMEVKDITVAGDAIEIDTAAKGVNLQEFPIIPEQLQQFIGEFDSTEIEMDHEVYASAERCPRELYYNAGVGDCRGYKIVTVHLFPVQCIPASGRLFYYPSFTITVGLTQTEKISPFYRGSSIDKAKVREFVDNPEIIDTYDRSIRGAPLFTGGLCDPSDSYDWVLITNNALNNTVGQEYNWSDLLDHRQMYGVLSTKKVTVEAIDSCPSYWNDTDLFNDSAAHVRAFIQDAYQNWGIQYVLLGGDWDTDNGDKQIVPARIFDSGFSSGSCPFPTMSCDLYYSNLDGTWWDAEHEVWGGGQSSSANDPFAEVYVGRLTVDNAEQVSNIVKKIIWYDLYADINFSKKAVFFGGDLGFSVTSAEYMEEVRNGTDPHFYECKGFVEWNEEHPVLQFNISERRYYDWGDSIPDDYKDLINNNNACIINHLSHGDTDNALDMSISELQALTNSKYFFAYSQGCLCGRFTAGDTTEKILMCDSDDNGAFALVFNTGLGIGAASTNGTSQFLQRHFWDYMFDIANDMTQWMMGVAHTYSKDEISAYIDNMEWGRVWAYTFYSAHLFGDPAQTIMFYVPGDNVGVLPLDVPSHITNKTIFVNATLTNNGQNDETGVVVSFRVNGLEVDNSTIPFFRQHTMQDVSFIWNPVSAGEYNITINATIPGVLETFYSDNEQSQMVIVGVQNIDTHECFETIQEAIDASNTLNGHTILAPSDIYSENVTINKDISLLGMNRNTTVIEGSEYAPNVIHVLDTCFVTVSGFTLRNGTFGVYVESSSNTTIFDNSIVDNTGTGISLESSENITVINCEIFNNIGENTGSGISLNSSDNVTVTNCEISNNTYGDTGTGISLESSDNVVISHNEICNNTCGDSGTGISLESSENVLIISNEISGNIKGIHVTDFSSVNMINDNDIVGNREGLVIGYGSAYNVIYHNNFNNTQNAFDAGNDNQWDNGYYGGIRPCGGNWWSDYTGVDEFSGPGQNEPGSDCIGDTPYSIPGGSAQDRYPLMEPWTGLLPVPATIFVDDDNTEGPWDGTQEHPYQYIQDGVDNAVVPGDTVFVFNGTYYEQVTLDQQMVSLIGEDKNNTIIDGNGSGDVVCICADWVNISGFTIRGNETTQSSYNGINVLSNHTAIMENTITNNNYGIHLKGDSLYNQIKSNTIINNDRGIYLPSSEHNDIAGNNITNNNYGIYLGIYTTKQHNVPTDNTLVENIITNNDYGIYLWYSERNTIIGNTITNNNHSIYIGDYVEESSNNLLITGNNITNNTHGIKIKGSGGNTITGNTITNNNGIGIFLDQSKCNNITGNNITNNNYGINLERYSDDNTIYGNLITNNNGTGIRLYDRSRRNNIFENTVTNNNGTGIHLNDRCRQNQILKNTITDNNGTGIYLNNRCTGNKIFGNTIMHNIQQGIKLCGLSNNNNIYHNNFINNSEGNAFDEDDNIWNNTYPFAGNYWSDHDDYDGYHGPDQNILGGDGIVDQPGGGLNPYNITGGNNIDWYPLKSLFILFANAGGPYTGYLGEPLNFSGSASGLYPPYNWTWDFGDGNASYEQNPSHIFNSIGNYTVVLTVTDNRSNSDNDTTTVIIEIGDLAADAHGPYGGLVNESIQFFGSATGGVRPYSWYWDFGDETNSTEQNPVHNYSTPDIYTVTLTVTDKRDNSSNDTAACEILLVPPVHNINKDTYYWEIQAAVDNASAGDTISVINGTYCENIVINKSITLIGEDRDFTIIDGSGNSDVVYLSANEVNISGFTIQNSGDNTDDAGVDVHSDCNIISGNNIANNNKHGIYLPGSDNTITNCNIYNNSFDGLLLPKSSYNNIISGNNIINNNYGIHLNVNFGSLSGNTLIGNNISNNNYGIYLEPTWSGDSLSDNNLIGNTITNNNYGIYLESSTENNITENTITNNNYGIYLESSTENTITENNITNNNGTGIHLNDRCRQNQIFKNTIIDNNGTGIYLNNRCTGNKIFGNNIIYNSQYGIQLRELSNNARIYHNNLVNNTAGNAWDECDTTWYNDTLEEGNYWDDFESNPGDPDVYEIPGGDNVDLYPLAEPWTPPVPGDTDHDDDVDLADLAQLLGHYGMESGATWEMGDFDDDGDVDFSDLAMLLSNYGYGTGPIPGDTDHDGDVDLEDLAQFIAYYGMESGATWEMGDFDGDGDVDLSDLAELLGHYGEGT